MKEGGNDVDIIKLYVILEVRVMRAHAWDKYFPRG